MAQQHWNYAQSPGLRAKFATAGKIHTGCPRQKLAGLPLGPPCTHLPFLHASVQTSQTSAQIQTDHSASQIRLWSTTAGDSQGTGPFLYKNNFPKVPEVLRQRRNSLRNVQRHNFGAEHCCSCPTYCQLPLCNLHITEWSLTQNTDWKRNTFELWTNH